MKGPLRIPAEWERHECCWLAFPYSAEEWQSNLEAAQCSIAALCRTIAEAGKEPVRLLVKDDEIADAARKRIGASSDIDYVTADYGDCWVRDTLPLLGHTPGGALGALGFRFNGWGRKFDIPFDAEVGRWLIEHLQVKRFSSDLILEGGALEFDGRGTLITTESCALNDNRNPGLDRAGLEDAVSSLVEMERLIWLERGLSHDHTDGHVDMIARFVAPDTVMCTRAGTEGPNTEVTRSIEASLRETGLTVLTLPSPGAVFASEGAPLPATYCNFYIANEAVILPLYGVPEDREAHDALAAAFPSRAVVGLPARDLLWGGGAFHCVTQPQPAAP
ncbi:MAG: agmatine deiminase family protein [Deltaproteobacteria bacterium]|nr:agmatine deiminase family protein [Deltaproteobacteria bacterium]